MSSLFSNVFVTKKQSYSVFPLNVIKLHAHSLWSDLGNAFHLHSIVMEIFNYFAPLNIFFIAFIRIKEHPLLANTTPDSVVLLA